MMPPRRTVAPARLLTGNQTEIGHELARIGKAREVADLRDQRHGIDRRNPPHGLQGVVNRVQAPVGKQARDLRLDPLQAPFGIPNGVYVVLEFDLLSGMVESQRRQPPPVGQAPSRPAFVFATMAQQEPLKMLTCSGDNLSDNAAQLDQVAYSFVIGVRDPDGRQLTGAMKTGQHGGVTTIGLHTGARLPRDQRGRNHIALMAEADELAMNPIAARSRLIAKRQWLASTPELLAKLANRARIVIDLADVFNRPGALALRDRDPLFVNIQSL